jgi:hypothetical protein
MNHETNWLPGIVVLCAGLLAAVIFAMNSKRKAQPAPPPSTSVDLEARYQALLNQLKEHAAAKHLMTAADWEAEQARLEQAAAQTLRDKAGVKHTELKAEARAEKKAAQQAASPAAQGFWARNQTLKGALWGAAVVAFFVALGYGLSNQSTERRDGQGMTGVVPPGGLPPQQQEEPPVDPKLRSLMARAQANPDDVDVLADAASELVKRQMFEDAAPLIQRGTTIDPYHVRIRICRAVLDAVEGESKPALDELVHLGATYDDAYDAHLYAGMLAMELKDLHRARDEFQLYVDTAPPSTQPPMIRSAIAQIDQELAQGGGK